MRYLLSFVGVCAGLMFIAASAGMNVVFWSSQGKTLQEGYMLGGLSLAVSAFNAIWPFYLSWASSNRRFVYVVLGCIGFAMTGVFALGSAIGFAASNRGAVTGSKDTMTARLTLASQELSEVEGKIAGLPTYRVARIVEESLESIKQDKRWLSSKSCADATAAASLSFCKSFFETRAELAAAVEGARLTDKREALRREVQNLKDNGAGQDSDPQAGLLARLSGVEISRAQMVLVCFVAVLVEFGAAFGLFFALGHSFGHGGGSSDRSPQPIRAEVLPNDERFERSKARRSPPVEVAKLRRIGFGSDGTLQINE